MQFTVELEGVDTLARLIAKYLADGSEFEVSKETNQIFVKVDDQEDGAEEKTAVQQEETAYTLEEVIKSVKEYTLKDKDGAMKLKPILQSLGAKKLSLLPKEKLPEFIEGARKVGVEI